MASEESLGQLRRALHACVRFVYGLGPRDHVSHLQHALLGCPLSRFYEYRSNVFMYRLLRNRAPEHLYRQLIWSGRAHTLRLIPHRNRTTLFNRTFFVRGVLLWNSLPLRIRSSVSLSVFQRELKALDNS